MFYSNSFRSTLLAKAIFAPRQGCELYWHNTITAVKIRWTAVFLILLIDLMRETGTVKEIQKAVSPLLEAVRYIQQLIMVMTDNSFDGMQ